MEIRDAVLDDFDAITTIYNDVLMHSTAIYSNQPAAMEDRIAWWRARAAQNFPVLVATVGRHVIGFGTFGDFRAWPGYQFTVEGTIHIDSSARGRGVGTALLDALLARAKALEKHTMMAGVDSENVASLGFLERYGFERVAYLPEVGYKFDRFLDLILLQYWITPRVRPLADSPEPSPHSTGSFAL
jgi:L-amino acid N-acyltransferase YncA